MQNGDIIDIGPDAQRRLAERDATVGLIRADRDKYLAWFQDATRERDQFKAEVDRLNAKAAFGFAANPVPASTPARQQLIRQNIEDAQAVFRKTMEFVGQCESGYTIESGIPAGLLDTAMRALEHVGNMAKEVNE